MSNSTVEFEAEYSESGFWAKCRAALRAAGAEAIGTALKLYYAMKRPETPAWAKTVILGALGYFISPIDGIPDAIPVLGFTDDVGVLVAALGTVSHYVDDEVVRLADQKLREWALR